MSKKSKSYFLILQPIFKIMAVLFTPLIKSDFYLIVYNLSKNLFIFFVFIFFVIIFVFIAYSVLQDDTPVIDVIKVSDRLKERGYTSEFFANRLSSNLNGFGSIISEEPMFMHRHNKEPDKASQNSKLAIPLFFSEDQTEIKIEIKEAKISLKNVINFIKREIKYNVKTLSVSVYESENFISVAMRYYTASRKGISAPIVVNEQFIKEKQISKNASDTEKDDLALKLFNLASKELSEKVNPLDGAINSYNEFFKKNKEYSNNKEFNRFYLGQVIEEFNACLLNIDPTVSDKASLWLGSIYLQDLEYSARAREYFSKVSESLPGLKVYALVGEAMSYFQEHQLSKCNSAKNDKDQECEYLLIQAQEKKAEALKLNEPDSQLYLSIAIGLNNYSNRYLEAERIINDEIINDRAQSIKFHSNTYSLAPLMYHALGQSQMSLFDEDNDRYKNKLELALTSFSKAIFYADTEKKHYDAEKESNKADIYADWGRALMSEAARLPHTEDEKIKLINLAKEKYKLALSEDNEFYPAYTRLGRLYLDVNEILNINYNDTGNQVKNINAALASFAEAKKLSPIALTYNNLGFGFYQLYKRTKSKNDLEKAIDNLKMALEKDQNFSLAYSNLSLAYDSMANKYQLADNKSESEKYYSLAIDAINTVIKNQPDYVRSYNSRGEIYRHQGKIDEAKESYEIAIEKDKKWHIPHNNLGEIFVEMGLLNEAISQFKEALKLQENYKIAKCNLDKSTILLKTGGAVNFKHKNSSYGYKIVHGRNKVCDAKSII